MGQSAFEARLNEGRIGESEVAQWLRDKGFHILPVYETPLGRNKGPAMFMANGEELRAPDMAVLGRKCFFAEVKNKKAFAWNRTYGQWVTGIDWPNYEDYRQIMVATRWTVWLFFLQRGGIAKDTPETTPIPPPPPGLYGLQLHKLIACISHTSAKYAQGMVYWDYMDLLYFKDYVSQ